MDSISVTFGMIKKDGTKEGGVLARMFVSDFRIGQKNEAKPTDIADEPEITTPIETPVTRPEMITPTVATGSKSEFTTLRFALAPGYAKRLSKIDGSGHYASLFNKLTNGFSWNCDMQVYINKRNGIGLNISGNHSFATVNGRFSIPKFGNVMDIKMRQRMFYIGPAWTMLFETKHYIITSNLSLGALSFTEKHDRHGVGKNFESQSTVAGGINFCIGGEIKISPVSAIGLKAGIILDSVSLFNIGDKSFKPIVPVSWSCFFLAAYISFRS